LRRRHLASIALLSLVNVMAQSQAPAETTVVRFGRLWDGTQLLTAATVFVVGDRITRVEMGRADVPRGAVVIDLQRYTGLPGLIDVHTHMTYFWDRRPGTRPRPSTGSLRQAQGVPSLSRGSGRPELAEGRGQRRHPAVTVFLAQENARRTLETGVTTVRDLNASHETDMAMRDLINMGKMIGPRMLVSGQGLGARPDAAGPDPGALARLAEERIMAGADWVKVFGSRGGFESVDGTQTVTFEEMRAVVEAAHALGRKVAIHSYGAAGVRDAVRAGADSVEHGADLDGETLAEMARRGTVWVPTIDHNRYYIDAKEEYGFAHGSENALKDYIERNLESARRAIKAGVRLAMGSDAVYTMFGQNTRELGWFVKAGMTPEQALTAATTTGAELLGLQDRLGRVAPGFLADLVAVEGDPLRHIDAVFTGVRWVMKDGAVVVDKRP
jgi:imidazolonepropionase-like amidohydrolase